MVKVNMPLYVPKPSPLANEYPLLIVQGEGDHYARRFNEVSAQAVLEGDMMPPTVILYTIMIELYNEVKELRRAAFQPPTA